MQHPDEGTIHAWLDGALSTEEGADVETHVAACAECAAAVAEARGLIAASSRIVSALDIVPGGVIPRQATPVRRPAWYSTTQFRAAAAVLFVAGASMLLVQDRDGKSVEELSQQVMSAPSAETSQSLRADAADETASAPAESVARATTPARLPARPQVAGPGPLDPRAQARREIADGVANAAPVMQAPPAAASPMAKALEGRAAGATVSMPENLAATGAAAESDVAGLTVVSSDSTSITRTTIFLVEPGATVTLTETSALLPVRAMAREQLSARAADASVSAPPPPTFNQRFPVISISWTDSVTKRNVTLSGPFSKEKLEELRKQIEARERALRLKD